MTEKNSRLIYPTPEEDTEINRQIAEDPDTREWSEEDWANAKSTEELFPEAAKAAKKRQADLDAGRVEFTTILLDQETIKWFKAQTGEDGDTGGTKWMALAEKTLREHAQREGQPRRENESLGPTLKRTGNPLSE